MHIDEVTPLILTYNEETNLRRTLDKLGWAKQIVLVDSFSTDDTIQIAKRYSNVTIHQRIFDDHTSQWNFGLEKAETEWILTLDADYVLTDEFRNELDVLDPGTTAAFFARFHYCIGGHRLSGNLYPPRAVLFRKSMCHYVQDGHTQVLYINGDAQFLESRILHDDRKPLCRWLESQRKYAVLEADKLRTNAKRRSLPDLLRRWIWPAAPAAFFYTLLYKRCLFDGWPGIFYALQRTYAELLLALELLDRKLMRGDRARELRNDQSANKSAA